MLDIKGPLWYSGPVEWRSAQYVVFKPRGNHTRWSGYIRSRVAPSLPAFYIAGAADAHGSTPRGTPLGSVSRMVQVW